MKLTKKEQLERQLKNAIKSGNRSKAAWAIVELERFTYLSTFKTVYVVRPSGDYDDSEEVYDNLDEAKICAEYWAKEVLDFPDSTITSVDILKYSEDYLGDRHLIDDGIASYEVKREKRLFLSDFHSVH